MIKQAKVAADPQQVFDVLRPHIGGTKKLIESLAYLICHSGIGEVFVKGREVRWEFVLGEYCSKTEIWIA